MLIWSSLSMFGLWIAHRTLHSCEQLQIASAHRMFQIRVFIFLTVISLNIFLREFIELIFASSVVIFLSPWWAPFLIEKHRERQLREEMIPLLDHLTLSMKSGRGFRQSLHSLVSKSSSAVRYALNEFLSALHYQKDIKELSRDPQILFFFQELSQVDQSAHKPIERLKALRRRLMIEKSFRQKSRQALLQVRFQSWIISVMYGLVLLYVHHDFDIRKHMVLVLSSSFLFLIGFYWVQRMGKGYKWKI